MTNHSFQAQAVHTALCEVCGEHKSDIAHWEALGYSVGDLPSFKHSGNYSFKITDASRKAKPILRLLHWPVNSAWGFIIGDDIATARPFALHGHGLLFSSRKSAVDAATSLGLTISNDGAVR